ncbi:uncharacterized protein BO87DRAFT_392127 [Aspergillus neoniger CBS 115656]|uniref:Uncharacterized protein n=1 Tax=Aspergillus neoniger (strain CBS 115656) TaxID=1448310 RepID=A0A318Y1E2_ASPNB|nr:hypothetical protein BO87DRAFT_392127 [Aspergillus neoniger CBS 115656]PYH28181.1 hypothetical protein BO87DRAFT_392127 [Aspergillus neoniger CBS 115656]
MAKDGGDWPIARRARRHLGTPRSRSLPISLACLIRSPAEYDSPSVDVLAGRKGGARMVGSLCAISPAHATDDQQQTVATSGFPAPWLTRCMILYGAHTSIERQTLETFLIGGGVHSRPAQAAQNRSEAELPGLIIRAIVWSSGHQAISGVGFLMHFPEYFNSLLLRGRKKAGSRQQSAEGASPVQVKYLKPLLSPTSPSQQPLIRHPLALTFSAHIDRWTANDISEPAVIALAVSSYLANTRH